MFANARQTRTGSFLPLLFPERKSHGHKLFCTHNYLRPSVTHTSSIPSLCSQEKREREKGLSFLRVIEFFVFWPFSPSPSHSSPVRPLSRFMEDSLMKNARWSRKEINSPRPKGKGGEEMTAAATYFSEAKPRVPPPPPPPFLYSGSFQKKKP